MDESGWAAVAHGDRYHGQIDTRDGHSLWVMPRLHLTGGWFVETRVGSPQGKLVDRRWVPTSDEGHEIVGERRAELSRLDLAAALERPMAIEMPRTDLGLIVAHGYHGRRGSPSQQVSIDGDEARSICRLHWTTAGPHELNWSTREGRVIEVRPQTVVHAHRRWFAGLWLPPEDRMVPPWHRCRHRSLRFEAGLLTADRDVTEAASGW